MNDKRGLAPDGWHIQTDSEWTQLINFLGDNQKAVVKIKNNGGWDENCNGTNESGFSALPGGDRLKDGRFNAIGRDSTWWSSSDQGGSKALVRDIGYGVARRGNAPKIDGFYVRCIKNYDRKDLGFARKLAVQTGRRARSDTNYKTNLPTLLPLQKVKIGKQIWADRNLDVSHFPNGEPIPEARTIEEWKKAGESQQPAWCYYGNDPENGNKYGKLYNWYAVNDPRGLAPDGWHVASKEEWAKLLDFIGGWSKAGYYLRSQTGWILEKNSLDVDKYGFSAFPAGEQNSLGYFYNVGICSYWWSSSESPFSNAYTFVLGHAPPEGIKQEVRVKLFGLSVRCVKY